MNQDIYLYTLPQWFVFAAIIVSVYGWVEHKKIFRMFGPVIFLVLGILSAIVLWSDLLSSFEFLTPEEIVSEEFEEDTGGDVPFQAMLFPAYLAFVISGVFSIPALILEWKNYKGKNLLIVLTALIALAGFFIIVGALKSL